MVVVRAYQKINFVLLLLVMQVHLRGLMLTYKACCPQVCALSYCRGDVLKSVLSCICSTGGKTTLNLL